MEKDVSVLVDLLHEAYPDLASITNEEEWLAGNFEPPVVFVQTSTVAERGNTLTSNLKIADAGIVLHHPKENGKFKTISVDPLLTLLRKHRYSYRGKTDQLFINIDNNSVEISTERRERTEITFRFEYTIPIPKEEDEKINVFEIAIQEG